LLSLPDFMTPRLKADPASAVPPRSTPVAKAVLASDTVGASPAEARKLVCATCGAKISFAEGKFCWNNEARFGGLQYCRQHQAAVRPASGRSP
jgi:hypothetical protein